MNLMKSELELQRTHSNVTQYCIIALLVLNAVLLVLLLTLAVVALSFVFPLLHTQNVSRLGKLMDMMTSDATNDLIVAAGPAMTGLSGFFNVTYRTQILPTSVPELLADILSSDIAPVALELAKASSSVLLSLTHIPSWPITTGGDTYADVATVLSFTSKLSTMLEQWVPCSTRRTSSSQTTDADMATLDSTRTLLSTRRAGSSSPASYPGPTWVENLLFGESALSWVSNQGAPTGLHNLGAVCDNVQQQLMTLDLATFTYATYYFDPVQPGIRQEKVTSPLSPETVSDVIEITQNICTALKATE